MPGGVPAEHSRVATGSATHKAAVGMPRTRHGIEDYATSWVVAVHHWLESRSFHHIDDIAGHAVHQLLIRGRERLSNLRSEFGSLNQLNLILRDGYAFLGQDFACFEVLPTDFHHQGHLQLTWV